MDYLGTCVNIDEDGLNYGFDPTEFAQAEERAMENNIYLSSDNFWKEAHAPDKIKNILLKNSESWYAYDSDLNISWGYEPNFDIHYIFHGVPVNHLTESFFDKNGEREFIYSKGANFGRKIYLRVDGESVCTLTYSINPNVTYTQDKNPNDYIYVEMIETPEKFRRNGFARECALELKRLFPDKILIGSMNRLSKNSMKGIVKEIHDNLNESRFDTLEYLYLDGAYNAIRKYEQGPFLKKILTEGKMFKTLYRFVDTRGVGKRAKNNVSSWKEGEDVLVGLTSTSKTDNWEDISAGLGKHKYTHCIIFKSTKGYKLNTESTKNYINYEDHSKYKKQQEVITAGLFHIKSIHLDITGEHTIIELTPKKQDKETFIQVLQKTKQDIRNGEFDKVTKGYGASQYSKKDFDKLLGDNKYTVLNLNNLTTSQLTAIKNLPKVKTFKDLYKFAEDYGIVDHYNDTKDTKYTTATENNFANYLHNNFSDIRKVMPNASECFELFNYIHFKPNNFVSKYPETDLNFFWTIWNAYEGLKNAKKTYNSLNESVPSQHHKEKMYYHGTTSRESYEKILTEGIIPISDETRKGFMKPVDGKVYLTPDMPYGAIYALGGCFVGHEISDRGIKEDRYGYLFEVPGSELNDIQPDEEEVGNILSGYSRRGACPPWLENLAKYNLGDYTYKKVKNGDYPWVPKAGKKLVKLMNDAQKIALIDMGVHIANHGKVMPSGVYLIDKTRTKELKEDCSNILDISEYKKL